MPRASRALPWGYEARCSSSAFDKLAPKGNYLAILCGQRPLRHIMLQLSLEHVGFLSGSFGSAADVLDCETGEERDSAEPGFGLGHGYDFRATSGEPLFESTPCEIGAVIAVKSDAFEVGIEARIARENDMAVVGAVAHWRVVFIDAIPVPDGEDGGVRPSAYAAETQRAIVAVEVDDRVGAECEEADAFIEGSVHCQRAACQCHTGVIIHGIPCCNEEGAAVYIDDRAVAQGAGRSSLEGAAVNGGRSGVGI